MSAQNIFNKFELSAENLGTSLGAGEWVETSGAMLESFNPTNGELLGKVQAADADAFNRVVESAQAGFKSWRMVPAPKRGDAVELPTRILYLHV